MNSVLLFVLFQSDDRLILHLYPGSRSLVKAPPPLAVLVLLAKPLEALLLFLPFGSRALGTGCWVPPFFTT
jgi:hypothetical protein